MPWPVRSRLLHASAQNRTGGAVHTLGVVPAGKTWLIKDWRVYNSAAGPQDVNIGLKLGPTFINCDKLAGIGVGQVGQHTPVNIVLPAGAELYMVNSATGIVQIVVSGAELG